MQNVSNRDIANLDKILQSDWMDYRTWTIYIFPCRLFIQLSVTVKTQAFRKNGKDTVGRRSLKVSHIKKIVGEFSKTFWKNQK